MEPCKLFKLERPSTEKLEVRKLDGVFFNILLLWNSKNAWFCICDNESDTVATIMTEHTNNSLHLMF